MRRRRPTAIASTAVALGFAGALVALQPTAASAAGTPVTVTVNARAGLAAVPDTSLGVNDAVWDSQLGTPAVSDLLKSAGVRTMRYPGGSYADIYHWKDNTAPGGYVAPNTDFDTFMGSVQRVGAQAMIIANYGTGTPQEAADWVRYANVTKNYGARYWTIGNENYGNGHYGANWEADDHADKSATAYANGVVAFADAMKAVDPTVKVGAVLTMPGNWPDGITGSGDPGPWNQTVLGIAGSKIDFVDVHWYPGGSAAESLSRTDQIVDAVHLLRQQLTRYAGAGADRVGIGLTETNVDVGRNTQPAALFLADAYSALLEQGVFTIDWWNVHNGLDKVSTVAGQQDYGDYGLLSSGNCTADGATCQPALNTPFAPYHGLAMMNTFAHPGDQFVRAGTDQSLVTAHAVRRSNGDLAVLLVNKDPDHGYDARIDYAGYAPAAGAPSVVSYLNGATSLATAATGTATSQSLPPYSLTTLVLHPTAPSVGAPGAPGRPTADAVTATGATISWPAATAGARPVAKYEVFRANGVTSEQLGETAGTSFAVGNLTPGTRYTVNVLARDGAGAVSWSSPPLTFTTGTPASSSCTVKFTDANDWGNGYVANVDVTNSGTAAIDGWTLTFAWPTHWQQVSSGWSGTWQQTGTSVRVTSDGNGKLAPGAATTIGMVASYSGPNVLPTAFTLNGTVCRTA